jgi:hypothetical protein
MLLQWSNVGEIQGILNELCACKTPHRCIVFRSLWDTHAKFNSIPELLEDKQRPGLKLSLRKRHAGDLDTAVNAQYHKTLIKYIGGCALSCVMGCVERYIL